MCMCTHNETKIHSNVYTRMNKRVYTYTETHTQMCLCTHRETNMYTNMHTHMQTHIYTDTHTKASSTLYWTYWVAVTYWGVTWTWLKSSGHSVVCFPLTFAGISFSSWVITVAITGRKHTLSRGDRTEGKVDLLFNTRFLYLRSHAIMYTLIRHSVFFSKLPKSICYTLYHRPYKEQVSRNPLYLQ